MRHMKSFKETLRKHTIFIAIGDGDSMTKLRLIA